MKAASAQDISNGIDASCPRPKLLRRCVLLAAVVVAIAVCGVIATGSFLIKPYPGIAGALPPDLPGETVSFPSESGSVLKGWFIPAQNKSIAMVLMHGLHGSRRDMLGRARFLHREGYPVLLFDFQSHGESPGKQITFGHLESKDACAAVQFLEGKLPRAKVVLIGISMGGAAAVLADPALPVNGMVLEMVYPTIEEAVQDRLQIRFGKPGRLLEPLLTCQLGPRLGIKASQLRPIDSVKKIAVPKLFIAGTADPRTTLEESERLFAAAASPKEFWVVTNAAHIDLYAFAPADYESHVLEFLRKHSHGF